MVYPDKIYKKAHPDSSFTLIHVNMEDATGRRVVHVNLNVKYCEICKKAELYVVEE